MTIMTSQQLYAGFAKLRKHSGIFRSMVQEMLVSCAYYAYKEGSTTEFNRLLESVGNGTHIKGITMWIELAAGIGRVKKGEIVLNKKVRDMSGVIDAKTFEPYEKEMRSINWWEIAGEQKAESVFDKGVYLNHVYKRLDKNGFPGLAEALKNAEIAYYATMTAEQETQETQETQEEVQR